MKTVIEDVDGRISVQVDGDPETDSPEDVAHGYVQAMEIIKGVNTE